MKKEELIAIGFDEYKARALCDLICPNNYIQNCEYDGTDIIFDLSGEYFDYKITLTDIGDSQGLEQLDWFEFGNAIIHKSNDYYLLEDNITCFDYNTDEHQQRKISIIFKNINVFFKAFKIEFNLCTNTDIWNSLIDFANIIYNRTELSVFEMNDREKAIYPLLSDLYQLSNVQSDCNELNVFKKYLPKSKKTDSLFEDIADSNGKKNSRAVNKLISYLEDKKYEDSWRKILNLLTESQSEYEKKQTVFPACVTAVHQRIESDMHAKGYEGSYPSFEKSTIIKHSDFIFYGISNENVKYNENARVFIEFVDSCIDVDTDCSDYYIDTYSITEVANKNNTDKYGAVLSGNTIYNFKGIKYHTENNELIPENKNIIDLICKKAELKRLKLREKKQFKNKMSLAEISIIAVFSVFISILIALIFVLGMMIFEVLIVGIFKSFSAVPEIFLDTPWLKLFLYSWLIPSVTVIILSLFSE